MIGRMEPLEHARLIAATFLLLQESAAARADLDAARTRFSETRDSMRRALLETPWPIEVPGAANARRPNSA